MKKSTGMGGDKKASQPTEEPASTSDESICVENDSWAGMYQGERVGDTPHGAGTLKFCPHLDDVYKGE